MNHEPKIFLIAETTINPNTLRSALYEIGGDVAIGWLDSKDGAELDGQFLSEISGRICYKSFGVGLNPNITKIRDSSQEYHDNTLAKGDGSIYECGTTTWAFIGVSRIFTHELVRHRAGVAISQESLRYVRPTDLKAWLPPDIPEAARLQLEIEIEREFRGYQELEASIDWNSMGMQEKKKVTSALRRMLPDGVSTNIVWTANHRTLRHVITARTSEAAEVEIRFVFDKVAQIVTAKYPLIYQDFEQGLALPDGTHVWTPKYMKV